MGRNGDDGPPGHGVFPPRLPALASRRSANGGYSAPLSAYNTRRAAWPLMSGDGARREQRRLRPVGNIETPNDLLDMRLDRAFGHVERVGDQLICFALGDQRQDIAL